MHSPSTNDYQLSTTNHPLSPTSPWSCLESLPGLIALPRVWRSRLGEMFERVKALILQDGPNAAQLVPCPRGCGLAHEIVCRADGSLFATCCGDPARPEEIPLTPAEIMPLAVSWAKLAYALHRTLGLRERFRVLQPPNTIQFGAWSEDAAPAVLTIQAYPSAFRRVVCELIVTLGRPFMLFAPTSRHLDADCLGYLAGAQSRLFPLDSTVLLNGEGRLYPVKAPEELFTQFTPERKEADETAPPTGHGSVPSGARTGSRYQCHRKGRLWEIVFDAGQPFSLKDTLGIRYLHYLLHHPNEPISAFELEVALVPDKRKARALNSIQPQLDAQAKREYRQALRRLRAAREEAQAKGDLNKFSRLAGEIEALESALKDGGGPADAGERARLNVHKAIKLVLSNLLSGGEEQRAFAQHIRGAVSLGYKCLYSQSQGRIWG